MFNGINSHGGVVNEIIGDGRMAVFGAPLPLDCQRAFNFPQLWASKIPHPRLVN
jgi:class 3 adenylate cyclase